MAEGGHFLTQHFELVHDGRDIKGIEIIGYLSNRRTSKPGHTVACV